MLWNSVLGAWLEFLLWRWGCRRRGGLLGGGAADNVLGVPLGATRHGLIVLRESRSHPGDLSLVEPGADEDEESEEVKDDYDEEDRHADDHHDERQDVGGARPREDAEGVRTRILQLPRRRDPVPERLVGLRPRLRRGRTEASSGSSASG